MEEINGTSSLMTSSDIFLINCFHFLLDDYDDCLCLTLQDSCKHLKYSHVGEGHFVRPLMLSHAHMMKLTHERLEIIVGFRNGQNSAKACLRSVPPKQLFLVSLSMFDIY